MKASEDLLDRAVSCSRATRGPRVLYFLDQGCGQAAGASRPFAVLAARLADRVDLVAALSGSEIEPGVLSSDWFRNVPRIDYQYGIGPGSVSLKALRRLSAILSDGSIGVIHCNTYGQVVVSTLASRLSKRRCQIILTDHNSLGWTGTGRVKRLLCLMLTRPHLVLLARESIAVRLGARLLVRTMTHITNGVDTTLFNSARHERRSGPVRILYPARLAAMKGHHDLIRAARLLVDQGLDVEIRLAGEGPLRPELDALVEREGLKNTVLFLGHLWAPALAVEMSQADIGVYPSHSEMMPYAVLEMMASGLAVVASGVGGISDVIVNGLSGYLVEPSNVVGLSERLAYLIRNPEIARELGKTALSAVRTDYSISRVADKVAALYERVWM